MKKTISILIISICLISGLNAQTVDRRWNIGLHGGITQYNGDLGQGFYDFSQAYYGFGGVSLSYALANHLDLSLMATFGESGFIEDAELNQRFRAITNTYSFNLRYNLLGMGYSIRPYLFVGVSGISHPEKYTVTKTQNDWGFPLGIGFNFPLGDVVNLQLQETIIYTNDDKIDGLEIGDYNDGFMLHTLGLTFNLGKCEDVDEDGVCDKKDKCLNTPKGVTVDKEGCPVDTDKDGTADYQDDCPTIVGLASLKGCPDKDADGVADKDDDCPDVKGLMNLKGCPDEDLDGVVDKNDKCLGTKAGFKVDATGCPLDNDKDGVANEEDVCPDLAGPVALKGCPDTDGDGIMDKDDVCPTVAGIPANKGCPPIAPEDVKKINTIGRQIYFEFASDKLKKSSKAQLNFLVELMNKYPGAKMVIEGHTDNQGDDASNMTLSQKRVDAVKDYLILEGIPESRLTAIGFGETKPVADNKTSTGRAKNRRVDLRAEY